MKGKVVFPSIEEENMHSKIEQLISDSPRKSQAAARQSVNPRGTINPRSTLDPRKSAKELPGNCAMESGDIIVQQ